MIKLHSEFEIDFPKITKLGMTDRQTDGRTAMKSNNSPPPPPPPPPDFTGRGLINGISAEI